MQVDVGWQELRQRLQAAAAAQKSAECIQLAHELLSLRRPADISFCATLFRTMRNSLLEQGHQLLKTFIVRSVTVEPILPALHVEAVLHGYVLETRVGGYGSYMMELMNSDEDMRQFSPDLVCVLLDLEDIAGDLPQLAERSSPEELKQGLSSAVHRMAQLLQTFRSENNARIVLQGCVQPASTSAGFVGEANVGAGLVSSIQDLNRRLAELCRQIPGCVFLDVDEIAGSYGRSRWRDERMFLATRLPLAPDAFRLYANKLLRSASVLFRPPRKVLCTDLDNTLWGGILGEDGPKEIATGAAFPGNCYLAYQRYLKGLAARGILLAITSKNNEADVAEAFQMRAADLAIGLDDFVVQKVSWDEKVSALRDLASELSVGLDSLVFVDDNPTECEAVRQHLPEVAVFQVSVEEPWRNVAKLAEEWYFDALSITADDRLRNSEYKAQNLRAALSKNATSKEEFLAALEITCTIVSAEDAPLERFVQLLAKTNQFNLTTRRHSASEVMNFVNDPNCQAIAVRVRDRFGDAGVVGLALTRRTQDVCTIDSLLLSCRVIGRGIESAILAHIAGHALSSGARWLLGEFIETQKNAPCKYFFPENGFEPVQDTDGGTSAVYRLDLTQQLPKTPPWLTLEGIQKNEPQYRAVVAS